MRTTFELVTNSFANVTSESVFTIATCGISTESCTDFPYVSAQEYDVQDLSAQRSSLESLPVL